MRFLFKKTGILAGVVYLGLAFGVTDVLANPGNASNVFNKDIPVSLSTLPLGKLRSTIESLPAPAQAKALGWLKRFEFPAADVAFLRADQNGGIFYEDPVVGFLGTAQTGESTPVLSELTQAKTFHLHSNPGASRTVYLDMDGHIVSGTAWNATYATLDMLPYDTDSDTTSFSLSELNDIAETWKRVSEDYAPFDIDVTTEEPASFGPNVGHILISPRYDRNNNPIYSNAVGGVAYVDVWGLVEYSSYQPALVFPEGTIYSPQAMSEAASHELGHNLGLSHDGTNSVGYYEGHGTGNTSWAPIMGAGYYSNVTQWSKGEYANANNQEDDLAIISANLTYRTDDYTNSDFAGATALVRTDATTVSATNPVSDPDNLQPYNKGVIENLTDVDLFYFDTGAGDINLSVTPSWIEYFKYEGRGRGANLDIKATLYDETGTLIAQNDPTDDTFARITTSVFAGRYILAIEGVGVGGVLYDGYSDYGSLGQYFINGTIPENINYTAAPTAPSDVLASSEGETGIRLDWTDPIDSNETTNEAGYKVYRQKDGAPAELIANLVRDSYSFTDVDLANGSYTYYLEVFNSAGSNTSNITEAIKIAVPTVTHAISETTIKGLISSGSYLDTANNFSSEVLSEAHQGGKPSARISALEHIWTLPSVVVGATVTLEIDAQAPENTENDNFEFSYSIGGSYIALGTFINGENEKTISFVLPSDTYGHELQVKVTDTDRTAGYSNADTLTVYSISVTSTVGDISAQVPVVSITSPSNGYEAVLGTNITFSATANDYEDGDISAGVLWKDNGEPIGTGKNISTASLVTGTHSITATVTDSAGNNVTDTISITITDPNTAPAPVAPVLSYTSSGLTVMLTWDHQCSTSTCNYTVERSLKIKNSTTTLNSIEVGQSLTCESTEELSGSYSYKVYSNELGKIDSNTVNVRLK